jgi:hypothetical protein
VLVGVTVGVGVGSIPLITWKKVNLFVSEAFEYPAPLKYNIS